MDSLRGIALSKRVVLGDGGGRLSDPETFGMMMVSINHRSDLQTKQKSFCDYDYIDLCYFCTKSI